MVHERTNVCIGYLALVEILRLECFDKEKFTAEEISFALFSHLSSKGLMDRAMQKDQRFLLVAENQDIQFEVKNKIRSVQGHQFMAVKFIQGRQDPKERSDAVDGKLSEKTE